MQPEENDAQRVRGSTFDGSMNDGKWRMGRGDWAGNDVKRCIVPIGTPSEHAFVCVTTRAAEDEDLETGAWLRSTAVPKAHEAH
jgi:hypothetical protein